MGVLSKTILLFTILYLSCECESAKINTPRVLLPWFEHLNVNFTFEIIEGGCYTWSLSRDDIIDLEPLYEDSWGHCSRAARVSVSKTCVPPGSVIILAEEVNSGEILRGDVNIDKIRSLKVMSTTWKLYLEEAPEAFEVVAYDDQGNTFSTLEGVSFSWSIENLGSNAGEDLLVTSLVRWRDTDYEAPKAVGELEALGKRGHTVLLYGQAMGESLVTVCLEDVCTDFTLHVVASVVLTPAMAIIAPHDTLRYRVIRARAGRLTVQDISETLYNIRLPQTSVAQLDDNISLVRGNKIGTTTVTLTSGATEVATATLTVAEPHSIKVNLRPSSLLVRGELFLVHCIVLDKDGHALTAGDEMLIRLTAEGDADVELIRSTENGTLTDAIPHKSGPLKITARLYSVAGRSMSRTVEGQVSAVAVEPLAIVPPELYVAWTDSIQEIQLQHTGGGSESVTWSSETSRSLSVDTAGRLTIRGTGDVKVNVHLVAHSHVKAKGRVLSIHPELIQVSNSGHARVNKPHHLHVALTATHPDTKELFNFHTCNCGSFAVSLMEGPEPHNVTAATWIDPIAGACCVLQASWQSRGVSVVRVSRGRAHDTTRVAVRAAPTLLWPRNAAVVVGGSLPIITEGEALTGLSQEPRIADVMPRTATPPHRAPDAQLFTLKCRRKGDTTIELVSQIEDERESVEMEVACAPHVSRIRLEPSEPTGNCSGGPKIWLRPNRDVSIKVTLLDAIGRELLDELGPKVSWEIEPHHVGIQYKATDRLFVETHPDFSPVPVPFKYFQSITTDEQAIGWSGVLKASAPEATASIQAKVAAPLKVEPMKMSLAWDSESLPNIATVTGGSGRYTVESPSGVIGTVTGNDGNVLAVTVPGPGVYDLTVTDSCVGERVVVEVTVEEILSVEVSTARAVGVGACVPITALVRGVSHHYLTSSRTPDWRVGGHVKVKDGMLCGLNEGTGRVKAAIGGVWSSEVEVLVFPPLEILPSRARLPPGGRLTLRHRGGPPPHVAALRYRALTGGCVEVSSNGALHGLALGTARIRLVATDINSVEMASAESEVEVIPITGVHVRTATNTLLVGHPSPVYVEAGGLPAGALAALVPAPRVTFSVRDPGSARLYTTHGDDMLERSVAEGLSARVVPLKPGLITIDVRVRNMGQVAETRSHDSTIEILAISDIRTSVEGLSTDLTSGERLCLTHGSTLRLKSVPRSEWKGYSDGSFDVTPGGEIKAVKQGHGVIIGYHKDEMNNIYRETAVHVEVSLPHYITAEPSTNTDEAAVRLVLRSSVGRPLLSPEANVTLTTAYPAMVRRAVDGKSPSALGSELVISGVETAGAFMSFQSDAAGVSLTDHVWVTGSETRADRVVACGGWSVCLEGIGWRAPPGVTLHTGAGVTLAVLAGRPGRHVLRRDRPAAAFTLQQLAVDKLEFLQGEWPYAFVPLSIEAAGLTNGPVLCAEDQKYALEGLQVDLPFVCRTKKPHTAEPVLDIANGRIGCKVLPASTVTEASEVELCAEWDMYRTCTRVVLLPQIQLSHSKLSLLDTQPTFTITGHPKALKGVKLTASPGLKMEQAVKDNELTVLVKGDPDTCGTGWINIRSKLTAQDYRVEVEKECDVTCGTLLGALFSFIRPYLTTLATIAAVGAAMLYIQSKYQQKTMLGLRLDPQSTSVLPPETPTSPLNRSRTWSRSPYAATGPVHSNATAPVYGDTSVLPDNSFTPNSTRMHSRFHTHFPSLIDMSRLSMMTAPNIRQPSHIQYEDIVMTDDFTQRFLKRQL